MSFNDSSSAAGKMQDLFRFYIFITKNISVAVWMGRTVRCRPPAANRHNTLYKSRFTLINPWWNTCFFCKFTICFHVIKHCSIMFAVIFGLGETKKVTMIHWWHFVITYPLWKHEPEMIVASFFPHTNKLMVFPLLVSAWPWMPAQPVPSHHASW